MISAGAGLVTWPTSEDELLLRAALLGGEEGRVAWRQWRREHRGEELAPAARRLLPLLAHNLAAGDPEDPLLASGRQAQRLVWGRNQALLQAVVPVVEALHARGIPVLVLKGAALAPAYGSLALRPMSDVDLLVPPPVAACARALCATAGFVPSYDLPPSYLPFVHAQGYRDAAGHELDLHWHALWECCRDEADEDLWRRAVPARIGRLDVLALAPSDQVLHVVGHGLRWSDPPSVHWLADLVLVLRAAGAGLDWGALVEAAGRRELVLQLRCALAYAGDRLQAAVLPHVLDELGRLPLRRGARLEMRLRARPPGLLPGLLLHWFDHRRLGARSWWRDLASFPLHLRQAWGLAHAGQLPLEVARKSLRRVRRSTVSVAHH